MRISTEFLELFANMLRHAQSSLRGLSEPQMNARTKYLLGLSVLMGLSLMIGCGSGSSSGPSKAASPPVVLSSVSVSSPAANPLIVGGTAQFTALGTYSDGSTKDISSTATWSSSSPSIATVSNAGLATAVSAGTDTISASLSGVTGTAGLTVDAKALTVVKVLPQGLTVYLGSTQQFEAIGSYNDGSTADVTGSVSWSSSAPASASISATGVASAVAAGPTTITASSANASGSSTLTVSPNNSGFTVVNDVTDSRLISFRDTDGSVVQYNGTRNANGGLSAITSAYLTHPNGTSQTVLFDQQERPIDFQMSDGSEFAIFWPSDASPATVTAFSSDHSFVFTAPFSSSATTTAARTAAAAATRFRQKLLAEQNAAASSDPSLVTVNVTSYDDQPENDATVEITESGTFLGGSIRADLSGNGVYQTRLPTGTSVPGLQTIDDLVQSTAQPLQSTCDALDNVETAENEAVTGGAAFATLDTEMCAGLTVALDAVFPLATPESAAIITACESLGVGLAVLDDVCKITGDASKVSQYLSSAATSVASYFNGLPVDVTATAVLNLDSQPQTNKNQPATGPFSPFNISVGSNEPVDKVQVTPSSLTLPIDASSSLTAGAYDSNSHLLRSSTFKWSWASDDENVATVPATGVPVPNGTLQSVGLATVTATANPGTANVTATEQNSGQSGSASVTVTPLSYTFTNIDDPSGTSSLVTGINASSLIVGEYGVVDSDEDGFLYSNGNFTTIDDPDAAYGTEASGINDNGQIVGEYFDSNSNGHGFLYSNGSFTTIDDPGSGITNTTPDGINNNSQIVGEYVVGNSTDHGFLYSNGTFTTIDDPNAAHGTEANGINDNGQIVGWYYDSNDNQHGFLYSNGNFTTIDFPGAAFGTSAYGINDTGQIVGVYLDSSYNSHGFLYSNGTFTTIDDPDAAYGTEAYGINDSGQIVGEYFDSNNNGHGFLATPSR